MLFALLKSKFLHCFTAFHFGLPMAERMADIDGSALKEVFHWIWMEESKKLLESFNSHRSLSFDVVSLILSYPCLLDPFLAVSFLLI